MEEGKEPPKTVEEILQDFKHRHAALVKALTTDLQKFLAACEHCALPEKEGALNNQECNLCLFGMPDGSWKVEPPSMMVPSLLPEPCIGINHGRISEDRTEWLYLVAIHADSWLVSMASFFAAGLIRNKRQEVLSGTCELPTIYETVAREFPRKAVDGAGVTETSRGVQSRRKRHQSRGNGVEIREVNVDEQHRGGVETRRKVQSRGKEVQSHGKEAQIHEEKRLTMNSVRNVMASSITFSGLRAMSVKSGFMANVLM